MASNSSEEPWAPMKINHTSKIGYDELFRGLGYTEDQVTRIMHAISIQDSDPDEFEKISSQIRKEREEVAQAYINAFKERHEQQDSTGAVDDNSGAELQNGSEGERVEE